MTRKLRCVGRWDAAGLTKKLVPRRGTILASRAVRLGPDLGLKLMVNLHPLSILVRGNPL